MPGTATGLCDSLEEGFFILSITFNTMQKKSPVKIMHQVMDREDADAAARAAGWSYVPEFSAACKKDGGEPREARSEREVRVYCGNDGRSWWEYVEGYTDIGPIYQGPPLNRDYTVLYRAIASPPPTD